MTFPVIRIKKADFIVDYISNKKANLTHNKVGFFITFPNISASPSK